MIIVTGSAGFIGSHIAMKFAPQGLVAVDKSPLFKERPYLKGIKAEFVDADGPFLADLDKYKKAKMILHMGAITNTAEQDQSALNKWNVEYSKTLWNFCTENQIPFIYASSAATYGNGDEGFSDNHAVIPKLKPLNLYGQSKQTFDLWALDQGSTPPHWYGLKFFNVYGPHENHKGRMASAVYHGYNEIQKTGKMTLFRSHNPSFKDGEQARDFIFVNDILDIIDFLITRKPASGIYNCGTGHAGTFKEMSHLLFKTLGKEEKINWIDTPVEFRKAYQYKTEAETTKLRAAGFTRPFTSLSEGIAKYLTSF